MSVLPSRDHEKTDRGCRIKAALSAGTRVKANQWRDDSAQTQVKQFPQTLQILLKPSFFEHYWLHVQNAIKKKETNKQKQCCEAACKVLGGLGVGPPTDP